MFARLRRAAPRRPITREYGPSEDVQHEHEARLAAEAAGPAELPAAGATLCDRYRLDATIARGASAVVWRATDLVLGEVVALKILLPDGVFATPEARASRLGFREEAVSAMRLGHPNILRVFNYERHQGLELLVMELVLGETLAQVAKKRPGKRLPALDTLEIGLACLDGLGYAHDAGVVHNDIKPSNLIMTRANAIKICDFGLAQLTQNASTRQVIAGTPGFMAPELLTGQPGDARSDLFALAATLYALGNGSLMMPRDPLAVARWQKPPRSPHLPLAVDEVLVTATAVDPRDRFSSAWEMRLALQEAREQISEQQARFSVFAPLPPRSAGTEASRVVGADGSRGGADGGRGPGGRGGRAQAPGPAQVGGAAEEALDALSSLFDFDAARTEPASEPPAGFGDLGDMVVIGARRLASSWGGTVDVAPFRLDRTPVTNAAYAAFVQATGVTPPAHWLGGQPPAGKLDHPVVGVSLDEARAYAAWRGKRLPTHAEWEAAARGPAATAFPWGDDFAPGRCRCPENGGGDGTAPVAAHADGAAAEGCLDLVGNAWEWTETEARLPAPDDGFAWVLGGSFRHPCAPDGRLARTAVATGKSYEYLGFRCAVTGEKDA